MRVRREEPVRDAVCGECGTVLVEGGEIVTEQGILMSPWRDDRVLCEACARAEGSWLEAAEPE